jgi:hypothetical protein
MARDETITGFGDKLLAAARRVILENGGEEVVSGGRKVFRIRAEESANVEPLPAELDRKAELRRELLPAIERDLAGAERDRARAAYLAIALGEGERLARERSADWAAAVEALKKFPNVVRQIYDAPHPSAVALQAAAKAQGIGKPAK